MDRRSPETRDRPSPETMDSTWEVEVDPAVQGNAAWRARLAEKVRPLLERDLGRSPDSASFCWRDGLFEIRARRLSGGPLGGRLRILCPAPSTPSGEAGNADIAPEDLPDPRLEELAGRLVGLEAILESVLLQLHCRWNGRLEAWSARTGQPVPPALRSHFHSSLPLFVFSGRPGNGKTSAAKVVAHRYCREAGVPGSLLRVGGEVREGGLVGEVGRQVRAAFVAAKEAARAGPCFLLIDEGDALAMRRSESQAHHEDRAGTAALLQCLDSLAGEAPVACFVTTNLESRLDPALLRRGTVYPFPLPGLEARREIAARWMPGAGERWLDRAAAASRGMTPCDIERALCDAALRSLQDGTPLHAAGALELLRRAKRTGEV